jgi:hypothetical protein
MTKTETKTKTKEGRKVMIAVGRAGKWAGGRVRFTKLRLCGPWATLPSKR